MPCPRDNADSSRIADSVGYAKGTIKKHDTAETRLFLLIRNAGRVNSCAISLFIGKVQTRVTCQAVHFSRDGLPRPSYERVTRFAASFASASLALARSRRSCIVSTCPAGFQVLWSFASWGRNREWASSKSANPEDAVPSLISPVHSLQFSQITLDSSLSHLYHPPKVEFVT